MKIEAMKLALEALCSLNAATTRARIRRNTAIDALREALAEQQEPVARALNTGTKQGVKWLKNVEHGESLYTSPPAQRTWVGLTDEDFQAICKNFRISHGGWIDMLALEIEAKLKEKNTC